MRRTASVPAEAQMIITKRSLPRRTFLRGVGATLSLPLLDAMVTALSALSQTPAQPRMRMGFLYVPNGIQMENFRPVGVGAGFEITPILRPLEPYRDQTTVLGGLANAAGQSVGRRQRHACTGPARSG